MKRYLLSALVLIISNGAPVQAEDTVIKTYIVAGQSNAYGFGLAYGDLLSGSLSPNQNLEDLGRSDLIESQDSAYIYKGTYNSGAGEWNNMTPGYGVWNGVRFGPELSFSKQITTATGDDVAVIKYSVGGTTLNDDWNPDSVEPNHYNHLITTVNNAKAAASTIGHSLEISGVLWMQGESDGYYPLLAEVYEQNLSNFITEFRIDLDLPDLPFHIGQIADTPSWGSRQAIWDAQELVASTDSQTYLVNGKDLPLFADDGDGNSNTHYSTEGVVTLGERFAESVTNSKQTSSPYPSPTADTASTERNSPISIDVLANDEGDDLSITSVNAWSVEGSTIIIDTGKVTFTPKQGFIGEDSFWYVLSDNQGRTHSAKVTVEVTEPVFYAYPEGNPDTAITLGQAITIDVLANDTGSGLIITYSHPWSLRGGRVAIVDNKLEYSPSESFSGEDSIWYIFEDSEGRTNSAKVNVDAPFPVAITEEISVVKNTPLEIDALTNDIGAGLTLSDVNAYSVNGSTVAIIEGKLLYTPKTDYVGLDSFWYVIKDYRDRTNAIEVNVTISD